MKPAQQRVLQALVIAVASVVVVTGLLAVEPRNWPVYLVYFVISCLLFFPSVEVLPRLALPIPQMAVTLGFLYVAGPPIIVLQILAPTVTRFLLDQLPTRWQARLPALRETPGGSILTGTWGPGPPNTIIEWATFTLGLGTRWWIVTLLSHGLPVTDVVAMVVAELGGYACWGVLSIVPGLYPDRRTLLPLSPTGGGLRTALTDIGLVVQFALTPFVFLINYGYRVHGLGGATAWSLAALGLHFMLRRLSDRRRTVEEQNRHLERLNRELEHRERLSAIGKMSSVVSHQILHQLGVIGLYADLIRQDGGADAGSALAAARANATAIESALRDVNRVLTDLLVFSKDLRLNLYGHSLPRVLEECVDACHALAAEKQVTLRVDAPATLEIVMDKLKMKQAIDNVLRNAIEMSPAGSEIVLRARPVAAGVAPARANAHAEIAVLDRGPGVPVAKREAIFAPFFTTKEHGTGLGLAIAREFTEAHGGTLVVEERSDGSGAAFVFRLPLRPAADVTAHSEQT